MQVLDEGSIRSGQIQFALIVHRDLIRKRCSQSRTTRWMSSGKNSLSGTAFSQPLSKLQNVRVILGGGLADRKGGISGTRQVPSRFAQSLGSTAASNLPFGFPPPPPNRAVSTHNPFSLECRPPQTCSAGSLFVRSYTQGSRFLSVLFGSGASSRTRQPLGNLLVTTAARASQSCSYTRRFIPVVRSFRTRSLTRLTEQ